MTEDASRVVLVAEDSDEDYEALSRAFKQISPDIPLMRCADGDELLNYLFARAEYADVPTPGLLLLDLNLPGTDGREVLEIIKEAPRLRLLPVIVLTTSALSDDIQHAYVQGANSYIFKPRDPHDFVRIIDAVDAFWFGTAVLPTAEAIGEL